MLESFRDGGFGMYPTLVFGVLALGTAVWYARVPDRRRLVLVGILSLLTLAAGSLGTVTGVIKSIYAAAGMPNQSELIALGTGESLNCIGLALILFVLTGIVAAVGTWRAATPSSDAARDPERAAV